MYGFFLFLFYNISIGIYFRGYMIRTFQRLVSLNGSSNFLEEENSEYHAVNSAELLFYNTLILDIEHYFQSQKEKDVFKFKISNHIDPLEGLYENIEVHTSQLKGNKVEFYDNSKLTNIAENWAVQGTYNFNLREKGECRNRIVSILRKNLYGLNFKRDNRFELYNKLLNDFFTRQNITGYHEHVNDFINSLKLKELYKATVYLSYNEHYKETLLLSTSYHLLSEKKKQYIMNSEESYSSSVMDSIFSIMKGTFSYLTENNKMEKGENLFFNVINNNNKITLSINHNDALNIHKTDFIDRAAKRNIYDNQKEFFINKDNFSDVFYEVFNSSMYQNNISKQKIESFTNILHTIREKQILDSFLENNIQPVSLSHRNRL